MYSIKIKDTCSLLIENVQSETPYVYLWSGKEICNNLRLYQLYFEPNSKWYNFVRKRTNDLKYWKASIKTIGEINLLLNSGNNVEFEMEII